MAYGAASNRKKELSTLCLWGTAVKFRISCPLQIPASIIDPEELNKL